MAKTNTKLKKQKLAKKPAADTPPKIEKKIKKKKKKTKLPKATSPDSDSNSDTNIETLLEPFSKDQLITLVTDLSLSNISLFSLLKSAADQDISRRKIFIHGLGWDVTRPTVESIFRAYGEIEDLHVVVDRNTGKCKGYAFITYKTRKAAKKLLKNPRVKVGNRTTSCQLAAEGPAAPGNDGIVSQQHFAASDFAERKIYVNYVPPTASAEKLRAFFEKFGEIENGPKGMDADTGRFKGYAIFVYKTVEGAKKVLEEPHKLFEGSQLHCQKAAEGKSQVASGAASITTALQPVQPQMLAAVAAAQQVQNMAMVAQPAGFVNPLYSGGMIANANLGALMGGYYGMMGAPVQGMGLGAYGLSNAGEVGSSGATLQGLQYMHPNTQSLQISLPVQGMGLGAYGVSNAGEGGSSGAMLRGLQYMHPNTQNVLTPKKINTQCLQISPPVKGMSLGARGVSNAGEVGSNGAKLQLQSLRPNTQSVKISSPVKGKGLGAHGVSIDGEGGSSGAMLRGLQYMYPNRYSVQTSSSLGKAPGASGSGYSAGLCPFLQRNGNTRRLTTL